MRGFASRRSPVRSRYAPLREEIRPALRAMMISSRSAFLHLPMVAGIVIFAFGVKTTLAHVHAHLHSVAAVALAAELPSTFSH